MSIKNNLINWKLILITIVYSVVCIIMIRDFAALNALTLSNLKKSTPLKIVNNPSHTALSNEFHYASALPPMDNKISTLSRGYIGEPNTAASKRLESHDYEDTIYALNEANLFNSYYAKKANIYLATINPKENQVINAYLPNFLMYKNVNITDLKEFLNSKNSLLVEEPYFSTIISVSKDFNLNPLVMFAITGQEQSFVPKDNYNAYKIANNPFNVFNSWKKYNTNIQDATSIAARTIVNLCKNRPNNVDAFTWINKKYSEDENWSKAIRSIFKQLETNVSYWK